MGRPGRLSPEEAKRAILLMLKDGYFEPTDHCKLRMLQRNITTPQLVHSLKSGNVVGSEWDDEYERWKYKVEGVDTEGDSLTSISVIIEQDLTLVIITAY